MPAQIDILLNDEYLLAVNKPAGVLTIPGRRGGEVLRDLLDEAGVEEELRLVHRLDRGTSGVLLMARTVDAQRMLSEQFQNRRVVKTYLALVSGSPPADEGLIDAPLARDPKSPTRMIVRPKSGKSSRTRWQVLERFGDITLVRCQPLTGRQHQIRVHLAHAGMPLLVDDVYGQSGEFYLSRIKPGYKHGGEEERPIIARLTLHAESLTFAHPRDGQSVRIEAPLPKDFRATLAQLRKIRGQRQA